MKRLATAAVLATMALSVNAADYMNVSTPCFDVSIEGNFIDVQKKCQTEENGEYFQPYGASIHLDGNYYEELFGSKGTIKLKHPDGQEERLASAKGLHSPFSFIDTKDYVYSRLTGHLFHVGENIAEPVRMFKVNPETGIYAVQSITPYTTEDAIPLHYANGKFTFKAFKDTPLTLEQVCGSNSPFPREAYVAVYDDLETMGEYDASVGYNDMGSVCDYNMSNK